MLCLCFICSYFRLKSFNTRASCDALISLSSDRLTNCWGFRSLLSQTKEMMMFSQQGLYVRRDDAYPFIQAWRGPSTNRLLSFGKEERPQLPMSHSSIAPGFALRGALWAGWLRWRSGKAKQLLVEAKCLGQHVPILTTLQKRLGQRVLTLFTNSKTSFPDLFRDRGNIVCYLSFCKKEETEATAPGLSGKYLYFWMHAYLSFATST